MASSFIRAFALSMLVAAFASSAFADEMVDNPNYKNWAKFKPGTFVVMKSTSEVTMPGGTQKVEATITTTLKSVTKKKVVVTMEVVSQMGDQEFKTPPKDMDYPAKIKKEDLDDFTKAREKPETKKGKETIEIAGKKVATQWIEVKLENKDVTGTTKIWECKEIPGGMAKMKSDMKKPAVTKTKLTVIKFEIKK